MSFDKGGIWKSIEAPYLDSKGKKIYCDNKDCSLHIHSFSSVSFGPFYTTENSVGILIGTGNVGDYL